MNKEYSEREKEVIEDIYDCIWSDLILRGYVPGEAEVQDFAEIMFELMLELGFDIDEYFEEDEDE